MRDTLQRVVQSFVDLRRQPHHRFKQNRHFGVPMQTELGRPLVVVADMIIIVLDPVPEQLTAFFFESKLFGRMLVIIPADRVVVVFLMMMPHTTLLNRLRRINRLRHVNRCRHRSDGIVLIGIRGPKRQGDFLLGRIGILTKKDNRVPYHTHKMCAGGRLQPL